MHWLRRSRKVSPTRQHNICGNPEPNLMVFSHCKNSKKYIHTVISSGTKCSREITGD